MLGLRCLLSAAMAVVITAGYVVNTPYGKVQGFEQDGMDVWLGIPFVSPPIQDLRFRPPQRMKPWTEIRDATQYGASCLQKGAPGLGTAPAWETLNLTVCSEDCLYINVYAPSSRTASTPLPVMLYLHAGEFRYGTSNDAESNWPYFAGGDVILVTANARLGILGFGALDEFRSRDPDGSSGNYGVQDQRAAMKWVQESIRSFGGDPSKVTIFGESSGGSSVAFHLTSKKSKGLFARAIMESPGLTQSHRWEQSEANTQYIASSLTAAASTACSWPVSSHAHAQKWRLFAGLTAVGGKPLDLAASTAEATAACVRRPDCFLVFVHNATFAELFGGGTPGDMYNHQLNLFNASMHGAPSSTEVRIRLSESPSKCLLAAAANDIVALNMFPPYGDSFETDASAITVDGVELIDDLRAVGRLSIHDDVTVMGGSNLDEGTEFIPLLAPLSCDCTTDMLNSWAALQFGQELAQKVIPLYTSLTQPVPNCSSRSTPGVVTSVAWQTAMRSVGDGSILCRTRDMLMLAKQQPAFWYEFRATPMHSANVPDTLLPYYGAFHGAEVPFVFGYPAELSSDEERKLSAAMGCYWTNFAISGSPNDVGPGGCASALGLPVWPAVGDGDALIFTNTTIFVEKALRQKQCTAFAQFP